MKSKIAIIHYRVGRTDGVSLEIDKRKTILEDLGYEVKLISGPVQKDADYIIDELEFDIPVIREIKEHCFTYFNRKIDDSDILINEITRVADKIKNKFLEINSSEQFSAVLIHNIFSFGLHIAAAKAFAEVAEDLKIPFISTNHDYYWERNEYKIPAFPEINKFFKKYVPPTANNITHISINSLAATSLYKRSEITTQVFPDILNFSQPKWKLDKFNNDFKIEFDIKDNDIIILQATRIVARKGIELAVDFIAKFESKMKSLYGKKLYNNKKIDATSDLVFVLAGYAEKSDQEYFENLKKYIESKNIKARFIHHRIAPLRIQNNSKKIYSLWDAYANADLVTYPSLVEGWGNQFIEAVFAELPIVLFEYPVFVSDIKEEGYSYISLGNEFKQNDINESLMAVDESVVDQAVKKTIDVLISPQTCELLAENVALGRKYHDYSVLSAFLKNILKN